MEVTSPGCVGCRCQFNLTKSNYQLKLSLLISVELISFDILLLFIDIDIFAAYAGSCLFLLCKGRGQKKSESFLKIFHRMGGYPLFVEIIIFSQGEKSVPNSLKHEKHNKLGLSCAKLSKAKLPTS